MDHARTRIAATAALLVGLLVVSAGWASAEGVAGTLRTDSVLELDGSVNATSQSALVNVLTSESEVELHADRVEVRMEWERGYITAEPPDSDSSVRRPQAEGVDWHNFTSATVEFPRFSSVPQVLSLPGAATAASGGAPGAVTADTVKNETVAQHGERSTAATRDVVGFYHTLEEPHVALGGMDAARVSGNFTLFVNNVTINVTGSDQGTWTNWTGMQNSEPDSPAGPVGNPALRAYEWRSTTLTVVGGTLSVDATNEVDVYTPEAANATVDGFVRAPSVSGELLSEPLVYRYDGDPLRLWGEGKLGLGLVASRGSPGEATRAPGQASATPPLALAPSGGFDVQRTSGVQVSEAETEAETEASSSSIWNPLSWFGQGTWLVLALVGAAVVGVGVGATVPERVHLAIGAAYEGWRDDQYDRWVREAESQLVKNRFERAETLASRATKLKSDEAKAWMALAMARFGSGGSDPERVLGTFRAAEETLSSVPKQMWDLWVTYALELDEIEEGVDVWLELADVYPERALRMYVEERMGVLQDDERVEAKIEEIQNEVPVENPEMAALVQEVKRAAEGGAGEGGDLDDGPGPEIA